MADKSEISPGDFANYQNPEGVSNITKALAILLNCPHQSQVSKSDEKPGTSDPIPGNQLTVRVSHRKFLREILELNFS